MTDTPLVDLPDVRAERAEDETDVMALVETAFGPGRYAKVSERIRERNVHALSLSFTIREAGVLIGTVRQWPVRVGEAAGLFLGPIAVAADQRGRGLGAALIARCVGAASAHGAPFILLVGDLPVFGPHGFVVAPQGRLLMPSPVAPHRVLVRPLADEVLEGLRGAVRAPTGQVHG